MDFLHKFKVNQTFIHVSNKAAPKSTDVMYSVCYEGLEIWLI